MIWYSPELDELMLIIVQVTSDPDMIPFLCRFQMPENSKDKIDNNFWYFIGHL